KDWDGVLKHGMQLLKLNPWDTSTLSAMATACEALEFDDAQLAYLRQALEVNIKSPEINRQAGRALARQGKFDDAIVCWTRVHQAKSSEPEAMKAIGDLTVEKTIQRGGYEDAETATDVKAEPQRAAELALVFAEIGVTRLIHAPRYEDGSEFQRSAETLAKSVRETLTNARPL
ncbi:MAG: hypothetical protein IH800_15645, partial [Myxococcales bacterium]|nr:hypothetical protein [Myxococcales bacterium]